jgi:glycosyltransferase involved in cell wall biosynthesis
MELGVLREEGAVAAAEFDFDRLFAREDAVPVELLDVGSGLQDKRFGVARGGGFRHAIRMTIRRRGMRRKNAPAILLAALAAFGFPVRGRMKVVVFAHTPPPHHGQSYMVELMLKGFADAKYGMECFHVNARFATESKDIGRFRFGKAFRLLGYCAQAIWLRFRHGAANLYYVPTPTLRNPLVRDWIILLICRPFFRNVIFHWHAAGLGEWLKTLPKWMTTISHAALDEPELSISLGKFNESDAAVFRPKRTALVGNGIPDPCPNFEEVARGRKERLRTRIDSSEASVVKVLYLSLLIREKGFSDAIEGVMTANALCAKENRAFRFELILAGPFFSAEDEATFQEMMWRCGNPAAIRHVGFVAGKEKARLMAESDVLCFPTYYYAESFGLVLVEAMAFGMPIVTTRWRSIPELLPPDYPGLVEIKAPEQIGRALVEVALRDDAADFRARYLRDFTVEAFLSRLAEAFHMVE